LKPIHKFDLGYRLEVIDKSLFENSRDAHQNDAPVDKMAAKISLLEDFATSM